MAKSNLQLNVELESTQGAQFIPVSKTSTGNRPRSMSVQSAQELEKLRQMFPPLIQEAMQLLIDCYRFEDRMWDAARVQMGQLEDADPEYGADENVKSVYNENIRPHMDAIHDYLGQLLKNKLEDTAFDVAF